MSWTERFCLSLLLAVVFFLAVRPALADDAIARRLAALKTLTDPQSAREVAAAAPRADGCPGAAWWRLTDYGRRSRIDQAIRDASLRHAVDPELIRSVIRHESAYDPDAVSHKGAMGLMQLMPGTARHMGVVCAFDPRENILGGARYLRRMYDRLGTWPRAVAAYHAGPGAVQRGRLGPQTRSYVKNVLRTWKPQRYATVVLE